VIQRLNLHTDPASLIQQIAVTQPPNTVLLKVTARAASPGEAQRLADTWVAALSEQVQRIEAPGASTPPDGTPRIIPIESADLPRRPVAPNELRDTLIGLTVGLGLGLAYGMARSRLDRRLRSATDVERVSSASVVGVIPKATPLQSHPSTHEDPATMEAFLKLRTNLMYMDVDQPPRVMVITSPQPSDGKSTVAMHVAVTLERSGHRVVVVDADLRRPTLAERFGVVPTVGVTSVLSGQISLDEAIQRPAGHLELGVLAAGAIPPNPSELLGSQAMRSLLRSFGDDTYVILDAPPLVVTDAAILTAAADGAFLVVSSGKTLDTDLTSALAALDKVHGRALGVILNRAAPPSRNRYGAYGYGYVRAPRKWWALWRPRTAKSGG
jgi:capsular exopolysaccharide synthesis family protein